MKKVLIVIMFALMFIPNVNAKLNDRITISDSIKYENETIKVSGTSNNDDDVQVAIFDGNNMIIYGVAPVTNDNYNYVSSKITLTPNKEYTVKVASVNGQTVEEGVLRVAAPKNPQTYDGINTFIIFGVISVIGIVGCSIFLKKRTTNS